MALLRATSGTVSRSAAPFTVPWNLRLSPLIVAQTGAPFDIITSEDVYGDTVLTARPGITTNPNQPGVIQTAYGLLDPNPSPGETILPRNFGRGPDYSASICVWRALGVSACSCASVLPANRRIRAGTLRRLQSHRWPVRRSEEIGGFSNDTGGGGGGSSGSRYSLTASVSARNIFNHVNPGPIVGASNPPLFGQSNQIVGGARILRQFQQSSFGISTPVRVLIRAGRSSAE